MASEIYGGPAYAPPTARGAKYLERALRGERRGGSGVALLLVDHLASLPSFAAMSAAAFTTGLIGGGSA